MFSGIAFWAVGGACLHNHLIDIATISSKGGIAIWDLRLTGKGLWLDEKTWELIVMFKNDRTAAEMKATLGLCTVAAPVVAPAAEVPAK